MERRKGARKENREEEESQEKGREVLGRRNLKE